MMGGGKGQEALTREFRDLSLCVCVCVCVCMFACVQITTPIT